MKKAIIILSVLVLIAFVAIAMAPSVNAHPGRTDGNGGHTNHSTGEYHYHHGYSAHDHYDMDGDGVVDCPYDFDDKTDHSSQSRTSVSSGISTEPTESTTQPTVPSEQQASRKRVLSFREVVGRIILCVIMLPTVCVICITVSVLLSSLPAWVFDLNDKTTGRIYGTLFFLIFIPAAVYAIYLIFTI